MSDGGWSGPLVPPAPGEAPRELGACRAWLFTDLHLRADAPEEVAAFAASLEPAAGRADVVVVMGDLFDAWLGPEQWQEPAFAPLLAGFQGLAARDVRLILLRGNRDVLLEQRDGREAGAEVADSLLLETGGGRVLITHGDEFCLRDRPYQRLRWWLRRSWLRRTARVLPLGLRRRAAARLRRASREAVARKPLGTWALVEEAVAAALDRHGAVEALIGHLHVAEERRLPGGGRLRILPAWEPGRMPVEAGLSASPGSA